MTENKLARSGVIDLSSPTEWGKFAHAAVEDAILNKDATAEAEKMVAVIDENGELRQGRIDILTQGVIIDVKTHKLGDLSKRALYKQLDAFADQLHKYQTSPDVPTECAMAIFIEFRPAQVKRCQEIEEYLGRRNITVLWGRE